jgi:signal transduction histidine kinase
MPDPSGIPDEVRERLVTQPLFTHMSAACLDTLLERAAVRELAAGEILMREHEPSTTASFILDGDVEIFRHVGGQELPIAVRSRGDVVGEMGVVMDAPRNATVRAASTARVLELDGEGFMTALHATPESLVVVLKSMVGRLQSAEAELVQHQKMAALGILAAGLTHELNNPASALNRGARQLRDAVMAWETAAERVGEVSRPEECAALLARQRASFLSQVDEPVWIDPLERSDREERVQAWLREHGVPSPWTVGPALVDAAIGIEDLERMRRTFAAEALPVVVDWVAAGQTVLRLLHGITVSAEAISEIVGAVKAYTRLDQAPIQDTDIHEGIDQSLTILRYKLRSIHVRREYATDLPSVTAYASELNQAWTNLIDNAADAMAGEGTLTVRTGVDGRWVVVEVIDSGPGMSEDVREHLFDPFFTTKPPGQGTGLGLAITYNIVRKHGGTIAVESRPGRTSFVVRLPVDAVDG